MNENPLPPDHVLEEVAARHRVTVKALRFELEHGRPIDTRWGFQYTDIEHAAREAYASRKRIETVAQMQAEHSMRVLEKVSARHGVSVASILRERAEGDWPDHESAARHLAAQRGPGLGERLRQLFRRRW